VTNAPLLILLGELITFPQNLLARFREGKERKIGAGKIGKERKR